MLNALKLWNVRRKLSAAVQHEKECRESATFARDRIIPGLEAELRGLELKVACKKAFKAFEKCR